MLLAESRKSTKKVPDTGKNTENLAKNRKMPFWSHGKLKKNLRKAEKSIFFLRKAGNTPPICGPHQCINSFDSMGVLDFLITYGV